MLISDPIGDYLTRIRNAQQREKKTVNIPASKVLVRISEILKEEGFINEFKLVDTEPQKTLELELKYVNGQAAITGMKRVSKPGIRRYIGYRDIPRVRSGMGIAIMSTPKGLLTGKQAKAEKVGGEYVAMIY